MIKPTIVLTGGGSGGHIIPLLSLAHELKRQAPACRIVYIGLKGEKIEGLQQRYQIFDEVYFVPAGKFRRYHGQSFLAHLTDVKSWLLNARDFFRVMAGTAAAQRILRRVKPDIVFSKGGYVAVPVGIAAHWQNIPIVTHDSDAIPGLANRIVGRWAKAHATGMPPGHYPYPPDSIEYVGIPIDERVRNISSQLQAKYKKQLGVPKDAVVLLISGGGLGSLSINNKVVKVSQKLLKAFPKLYIFHITGSAHQANIQAGYEKHLDGQSLTRVQVLGFTPDFYLYSGAADLVVARAGATTIAELAVEAKPVLLIPAPFLTGGQQLKNVQELKKAAAVAVADDKASPQVLLAQITKLLNDSRRRAALAKAISQFAKPDAAKNLAKVVLDVVGSREKNS